MDCKLISEEERQELFRMLRPEPLDFALYPRCRKNLKYGSHRMQRLHLFLPENGDGPFPLIVYFHGGGWEGGGPSDGQVRPFLPGLERGYAVASCGYRLMPEAFYPDDLGDVKQALAWLHENRDELNLDTGRLVLAGSSAGAHLALLAAFTQGQPLFDGDRYGSLPEVRAVVDLYGPTDFSMEDEHYRMTGCPRAFPPAPPGKDTPSRLLQADLAANPSLAGLASPLRAVHAGIPKVLILHGKNDPMVSVLQSQALYERITERCGEGRSRLIVSEDTTHGDQKYEREPYTSQIFDFIRDALS